MVLLCKYIANINRILENIKLDIIMDYIRNNQRSLTITTNKVALALDFNTIEKYIKSINSIDFDNVMIPRLLQSKSYLKILGISYLIKDSNISITSNVIERIIQFTHIFNDVILASKPKIIKTSSKSDIAIIWINI